MTKAPIDTLTCRLVLEDNYEAIELQDVLEPLANSGTPAPCQATTTSIHASNILTIQKLISQNLKVTQNAYLKTQLMSIFKIDIQKFNEERKIDNIKRIRTAFNF